MSFWEPFLIIPNAPTTTGIISVFICHILVISFSRSLYLDNFSEGIATSMRVHFLSRLFFYDNIRAVCRNFSICMNRHDTVIENGGIILFFHRFWLVFVPLVYCVHFIFFSDLPVYIGCHIVVPVYLFCFC